MLVVSWALSWSCCPAYTHVSSPCGCVDFLTTWWLVHEQTSQENHVNLVWCVCPSLEVTQCHFCHSPDSRGGNIDSIASQEACQRKECGMGDIFAKTWSPKGLTLAWLCPHGGEYGPQGPQVHIVFITGDLRRRKILSLSVLLSIPRKKLSLASLGHMAPSGREVGPRDWQQMLQGYSKPVTVGSQKESSFFDTRRKRGYWQIKTINVHYNWFL